MDSPNALAVQQPRPLDMRLLADTLCKGATEAELHLFAQVCDRTTLDPFTRQIYWIRGKGAVVSIDGFRVVAERTGKYRGQLGPYWCGEDGVWKDVWLSKTPPAACRVGILRAGFSEPLWATALLSAYIQATPTWQKMAPHMLSVRAEALGLRRAFPQELSGLYSEDELGIEGGSNTLLDAPVNPHGQRDLAAVPHIQRVAVNAQIEDAVAGQRRFQDTPQEAEFVDVSPAEPAPPPPAAESQEVEIDIVAFDAETSPGKTLCKTFDKIKPPAGRLSDAMLVYPGALPADIAARVLETAAPWRVRATVRCTGNKNRAGELIYGVQRGPDNSLQFELVEGR